MGLKDLKGLFYRKLTEKQKIEEALPGFLIQKSKRFVEFPEIKDITAVNITYPLMEPFMYVNIKWDSATKELIYNVLEPKLTEEEEKILEKISDALIELVEVELTGMKETSKAIVYLEKQVNKVLTEYGIPLTPNQYSKILYRIYRNFVGLNEIEAFFQDPNIEDISCDGTNIPIYIIHRKFGSLKTNVTFTKMETLREFVIKLSERCGRYVSYAEPILDGTLPDGSRVSATLAGDVATRGPTFTVRKFSEKPFSPIDQILVGTADSNVLAYFWYLIEHGVSMLVVGGVATGKTSFLNTLCMFILPESKIVSIEDTKELRIPNEHWVPGLARVGFGIPSQTGEKYGEVTMFDLLKESFRQNPDYVIVGEVRGQETYVMFQGMSSGHPSLSTFHAGSVDTLVKRLTTPPIELSPTLIESLDVIVIMVHAREKGKSARRIKEIVEVESVDPKTDEVKTRVIFRWNPATDAYEKVDDSIKVPKIVATRGGKLEDAIEEIERRRKILELMKQKETKDYLEVTNLINLYYKEPKKVLDMIGEVAIERMPVKVEVQPTKPAEKPRRRTSILELLGFKMVRER